MSTITIYTTAWCGECHVTKRFFDDRGLAYNEIDIETWDDPRGHLEELTGGRTVPQIVIDGKPFGGYDTFLRLRRSGELEGLLTGSA
jgi:glutaredoxin 3